MTRLFPCRLFTALALAAGLAIGAGPAHADQVSAPGISYACYDPVSLILKDKGFLRDALGPNVKINGVLSQGSNRALEFLRGGSIQFGQTAGSAALLGRANGAPIQVISPGATLINTNCEGNQKLMQRFLNAGATVMAGWRAFASHIGTGIDLFGTCRTPG